MEFPQLNPAFTPEYQILSGEDQFYYKFYNSVRTERMTSLVTGTSTVTNNVNLKGTAISTGATVGSRVVYQTRRPVILDSEAINRIELTLTLSTALLPTALFRFGVFDKHSDKSVDTGGNGFFLLLTGTNLQLITRSYATGIEVDTVQSTIPLGLDRLIKLADISTDESKDDFILNQLHFTIGLDICLGFKNEITIFVLHNSKSFIIQKASFILSPFVTTNLPVRLELTNDVVAANSTVYVHSIRNTIIKNSINRLPDISEYVSPSVYKAVTTAAETYICAFRLKSSYNRSTFKAVELFIRYYGTSETRAVFKLYKATIMGGVPAWVSGSESPVEVDIVGTPVLGTVVLSSFFMSNVSEYTRQIHLENILPSFGADIAGTSDLLVLTCQRLAAGNFEILPTLLCKVLV